MTRSRYVALPSQGTTKRQQGNLQTSAVIAHGVRPDATLTGEEEATAQTWPRIEHNELDPRHHPEQADESEGETRRAKSRLRTLEKHKCQHDPCGAHFHTAEELDRHQAQGHPNVPGKEQLVCWWPRCGKDYVSPYYHKRHCELKCRYRNNRDSHRPSNSEKSVLTVTQGNECSTEETPSKVTTAPMSSQQSKRKASASKAPKGAKKTQKTGNRSPSPPPSLVPSYDFLERASSPEEDPFVTSRRPSAASIFPSEDEVGPANRSLTYLEDLDQLPSRSDGPLSGTPKAHSQIPAATGKLAHEAHYVPHDQVNNSFLPLGPSIASVHPQHTHALPNQAPQSIYPYGTQAGTYGTPSPHPFLHSPAVPAQEDYSGLPTVPPPGSFHLDPSQSRGDIPPDSVQLVPNTQYGIPIPAEPEQSPQPVFERIDEHSGTRMRIAASEPPRYRPYGSNGFSPNCQVFDLWTPEQAMSEVRSQWPHPPSVPYGGVMYYPGTYTD